MVKVKNKIIISDVTLRDGNHAVNHSINEKVIRSYCELIDETGVNIVEVGHGNGLGASSLSIGRSNISDEKALKIARSTLKKTKLSVHSIPGFSRIDDLKKHLHNFLPLLILVSFNKFKCKIKVLKR